jgi:hypothetical protein
MGKAKRFAQSYMADESWGGVLGSDLKPSSLPCVPHLLPHKTGLA